MTWIRLVAVITFLGCLLALPCSPAVAGRAERTLVRKLNKIRAANGLRPLRVSGSLNRSSSSYVRLMLRKHYFGHAPRIMVSGRFRKRGEVLGQHGGRRPRPGAAVAQWMASPLHRHVLLDAGFRYIGVGRAYGSFGGAAATSWVAQLGS
jgi:uncharacterized protein YkwD